MTWFNTLYIGVSSLYCLLLLFFIGKWKLQKAIKTPSNLLPQDKTISVIISARNEERNITKLLQDLQQQSYKGFELIIVDDNSTDLTYDIISQYKEQANYPITLIKNDREVTHQAYKKNALKKAIALSKGDYLVFTDADCRLFPKWLEHYAYSFHEEQADFISGPVSFHSKGSFFNQWQIVEFASLIGTGACSIWYRQPTMCNGANCGYTKETYINVDGYKGNEHIPSGDDEFLMHKVHEKGGKIVFLKAQEAIVYTDAKPNIKQFIQQRKRWASKWSSYQQISSSIAAIYIFILNTLQLIALGLCATSLCYTSANLFYLIPITLGGRLLIESWFLGEVLLFLRQQRSLPYIPLVYLSYPIYVIGIALSTLNKKYQWKGRSIN